MDLIVNQNTVVVFDLDDTLYNEVDYLKSGFKAVSELYYPLDSQGAYINLVKWYQLKLNPFENFLSFFNLAKNTNIDDLIYTYRFHMPKITLRLGALNMLLQIKQKCGKIGLITDGRSITQRNKIQALGIEGLFDLIVISEEIGTEKPSPLNYKLIQERYNDCNLYYIADNTSKDFVTPNALGWKTICYLDPGTNIHKQTFQFDKTFLPRFSIKSFEDINII